MYIYTLSHTHTHTLNILLHVYKYIENLWLKKKVEIYNHKILTTNCINFNSNVILRHPIKKPESLNGFRFSLVKCTKNNVN